MEQTNIWDTKLVEILNMKYYKSLEEAIENNVSLISFLIHDGYKLGQEQTTILDDLYAKNEIEGQYTDMDHPILYSNYGIYINSEYYDQNKNQILKYVEEDILTNKKIVRINKNIFSDELLNNILLSVEIYEIKLYDIELTEEQLARIKCCDKNISIINNDKEIILAEERKIFNKYNKRELKETSEINVETITEEDLNNIDLLFDGIKIHLNQISALKNDLKNGNYNNDNVYKLIEKLEERNIKYSLFLEVDRLGNFDVSKIADIEDIHTKLKIVYDHEMLDLIDYLKLEQKIDNLLIDVTDKDMSPLEKYLAVYDIVKKFKPYKENETHAWESRNLRMILEGDYIVCVGFSKLLITLLNKIGIEAKEFPINVEIKDGKDYSAVGHSRTLVNMIDDKYNVDGIYIADATWDNKMDKDQYLYALNTFDKINKDNTKTFLTNTDLIYGIHDRNEFDTHMNALMRRNNLDKSNISFNINLFFGSFYGNVYAKIMNTIVNLDSNKFDQLTNKYPQNDIEKIKDGSELNDFFDDIYNYAISKTNKEIDKEVLKQAIINSKIATNKFNGIKEINEVFDYNEKQEALNFTDPYNLESDKSKQK